MSEALSLTLELGLRHLVRPLWWAPVAMVVTFLLHLLLYRFWQSWPSSPVPRPRRESLPLSIGLLGILPFFAFICTSAFVIERGAAEVLRERGGSLIDAAVDTGVEAATGSFSSRCPK